MSKRPVFRLIEGNLTQEERRIYRLRKSRPQEAPEEEPWPPSGEWRDLVRRLARNPFKAK